MNAFLTWLDHRTGIKGLMHEALYERVPGGARWRYVWGSTLVFTFTVQMISGIFLWMAYSPSAQTAWESVYYIQEHMTLGWLVRGTHHFAAQAMVVLMALHLLQVIIDGAYKAPREVNYWLGLVLMQIVLGLSLTGYLLPWDQKGYYATQVATKIAGATPVIGQQVQQVIQGGPQYGHHTLTRFFALHTGVLPAALVLFLALHIYVFRRHGITVADPDHAPDTTFWPDQVMKDSVACLAVLATVMGLAWHFHGVELSAPANPAEAYSAARPEWYYLFLFRFLKFEAVEHFGLAFGAIYVPGAVMAVLVLMPLIAKLNGGHKFNIAFIFLISLGAAGLTALAIKEDKENEEHQAAVKEAMVDGERTVELAKLRGIPVEGALGLRREDPLTVGPRLFAKTCAACHRYDGHNGLGQKVMQGTGDSRTEAPATATDLGKFGTRDWISAVLLDYKKTFAPLKNADWYKTAKAEGKSDFLDPDDGEMAQWSETHKELLQKPENAEDLKALVEFMASLAQWPNEKFDATLVERGKDIYENGTLKSGAISQTCSGCHGTNNGEPFAKAEGGTGYPTLTGYASSAWLKSFIADPGSDLHYGKKNQMPAYQKQFSQKQLDMLVRWMTRDYDRANAE